MTGRTILALAAGTALLAACRTGPGAGNEAVNGAANDMSLADMGVNLAEQNRTKLWLGQEGLSSGIMSLHPINEYAFGMPRAEIVAVAAALLGAPTGEDSNAECGAGPMQFTRFGTLTLNFQEGRWVGWDLAEPAASPPLTTNWDVGIGSPRRALYDGDDAEAEVSETSLGTEFVMGEIGGLLSGPGPDAAVTHMWAGADCAFR